MKQKLQDLILLIKQERKYQWLAAGLVVCIAFLLLQESPKPRAKKKPVQESKTARISEREGFEDLVKRFGSQIDNMDDKLTRLDKKVPELEKNIEQDRERVAQIFKKMLDRLAETENVARAGGSVGADSVGMGGDIGAGPEVAAMGPDGIENFGVQDVSIAPPPPPAPKKIAVIGPGDAVRVKLLSGVLGATDGTPYPVVMKLVDDIRGPDGSALPLGEARVVAAAQGSLSDSRVLMRLTTLNIRLPDGRKKVVNIDGWVVGEDGLRGMRGVLIDPIGKAMVGAGAAGLISGFSRALAISKTELEEDLDGDDERVVNDPTAFAAASAGASAANLLAKIIDERRKLLVPHVQIYSGREATAIFSKTINITDVFESLEEEDSSFANSVD